MTVQRDTEGGASREYDDAHRSTEKIFDRVEFRFSHAFHLFQTLEKSEGTIANGQQLVLLERHDGTCF